MIRKTKEKDWVRGVMNQASSLSGGSTLLIELEHICTGERHSDPIGQDCWEDPIFHDAYEAMRAEDGFKIMGAKPRYARQRGSIF